jgi:hypothetical protein
MKDQHPRNRISAWKARDPGAGFANGSYGSRAPPGAERLWYAVPGAFHVHSAVAAILDGYLPGKLPVPVEPDCSGGDHRFP